ncbi:hypothetical protein QR685DRAFT_300221 [Neurospora intermedia]|uniref:Uncharacterized protein n=1 Tax=Neurospora intermedia TaxID=5142 RepID=A0ABR3DDA5_NEUIN
MPSHLSSSTSSAASNNIIHHSNTFTPLNIKFHHLCPKNPHSAVFSNTFGSLAVFSSVNPNSMCVCMCMCVCVCVSNYMLTDPITKCCWQGELKVASESSSFLFAGTLGEKFKETKVIMQVGR